jgi:hypothetical protein
MLLRAYSDLYWMLRDFSVRMSGPGNGPDYRTQALLSLVDTFNVMSILLLIEWVTGFRLSELPLIAIAVSVVFAFLQLHAIAFKPDQHPRRTERSARRRWPLLLYPIGSFVLIMVTVALVRPGPH